MPPAPSSSPLHTADWLVLGAYITLLIATGVWFSRRKVKDTTEYFLANRSMPVWAVAFSILATAQSAATFVAVPETSYAGDLTYLSANIGGILAAIILALFFIPAYYRRNVVTPYQLLETRFGGTARLATSWAYLGGRIFASGARIFVGALPACLALFGDTTPQHMAITIAAFIIFGICYTFVGGVSSAIWTDVVQVSVYIGAALVTILVLLHRIPVGIPEIFSALWEPGPDLPSKLTILKVGLDPAKPNLGFDPSQEFTLLTALTGFTLLTLASHGMDQDLVQRMLTCKSAAKGSRSVISGVLVGIPAVCIFLAVGLLLYIYYQRPDIMGAGAPTHQPDGSSKAFQTFAFTEMRGGLAGLFMAGLFAAGPAGINAGLNSMSSTFVSDIYKRRHKNRTEAHYLKVGRFGVLGAGLALGIFAILCIYWHQSSGQKLISFVLAVMNFAYAGLLGVFITALFTKRGNSATVLAALIGGFITVFLFQPIAWEWWTTRADWLATNIHPLKIAFPWQLVAGAAVSFALCVAGRAKHTQSSVAAAH